MNAIDDAPEMLEPIPDFAAFTGIVSSRTGVLISSVRISLSASNDHLNPCLFSLADHGCPMKIVDNTIYILQAFEIVTHHFASEFADTRFVRTKVPVYRAHGARQLCQKPCSSASRLYAAISSRSRPFTDPPSRITSKKYWNVFAPNREAPPLPIAR